RGPGRERIVPCVIPSPRPSPYPAPRNRCTRRGRSPTPRGSPWTPNAWRLVTARPVGRKAEDNHRPRNQYKKAQEQPLEIPLRDRHALRRNLLGRDGDQGVALGQPSNGTEQQVRVGELGTKHLSRKPIAVAED